MNGRALPLHLATMSSARRSALAKRPPPGPSVPTKSVSQNLQTADGRWRSRPVHRLQPANRQKTAARPVLWPSPCSVMKIDLTVYATAPPSAPVDRLGVARRLGEHFAVSSGKPAAEAVVQDGDADPP